MSRDPSDRIAPSRCDTTSDETGFGLWSILTEAGLSVRLSMDPFLDHFELSSGIKR